MVTENIKSREIPLVLLKDFSTTHTITSLAKELNMSRVGMWKLLKKLERDELIKLEPIGKGKTSTYRISLNWDNLLVEKTLALSLTQEALKHKRWRFNFEKLEKEVEFLILFGSILHSPKRANDVDILVVIEKKNLVNIGDLIVKIQVSQEKDIHSINFTKPEFKKELKKGNKAYAGAIKKGVILFGQESFINFMKEVHGYGN
ncbi:MAG: hypothetical protein ABIB47_00540 [Candidatus Woesearchaeota archaeon]